MAAPVPGAADDEADYVDEGVESSSLATTSPAQEAAAPHSENAAATPSAADAGAETVATTNAPNAMPPPPGIVCPPPPRAARSTAEAEAFAKAGPALSEGKASGAAAAEGKAAGTAAPEGKAPGTAAAEGKAKATHPAAKARPTDEVPAPKDPPRTRRVVVPPKAARACSVNPKASSEAAAATAAPAERTRRVGNERRDPEAEEAADDDHTDPRHVWQECEFRWRTVWGGQAGMDQHRRTSQNCLYWQGRAPDRRERPTSPPRGPAAARPEGRRSGAPHSPEPARARATRAFSPGRTRRLPSSPDDERLLIRETMANIYRPPDRRSKETRPEAPRGDAAMGRKRTKEAEKKKDPRPIRRRRDPPSGSDDEDDLPPRSFQIIQRDARSFIVQF